MVNFQSRAMWMFAFLSTKKTLKTMPDSIGTFWYVFIDLVETGRIMSLAEASKEVYVDRRATATDRTVLCIRQQKGLSGSNTLKWSDTTE